MAGVDERMATIKSERVIRPLRPKEDGGGCVKGTAFQKSGVMSDNLDRLLRRKRKGGGRAMMGTSPILGRTALLGLNTVMPSTGRERPHAA